MDILNTDNITNVTVRKFLEDKLFPNLRVGLQELVDMIHDNGELDIYWEEVEKKNEEARRAARRLDKERKRLEMGSDYEDTVSEEDQSHIDEEGEEGEWEGEEDEEEEEEESELEREVDGKIVEERLRKNKKKKKNLVQEPVFNFDPVKFLAKVLRNLEDKGEIPVREAQFKKEEAKV
mmetsp:Transcript_27932/g.24706  ORF Transcript_27932/g.24706 Transcript_27932/m.24706 type:complete len:178 (+) Transcript_27932:11-544(+)